MQFRPSRTGIFQSRTVLDAIPHPEQRPFFNQEHHCKKIPPYVIFFSNAWGDTRLILLFRFKMRSDPSDRSNAFLRHIRSQPPKSIQSKSALYQPVFTRPAATPLIVSRTSVTRSLGGLSLSRNF